MFNTRGGHSTEISADQIPTKNPEVCRKFVNHKFPTDVNGVGSMIIAGHSDLDRRIEDRFWWRGSMMLGIICYSATKDNAPNACLWAFFSIVTYGKFANFPPPMNTSSQENFRKISGHFVRGEHWLPRHRAKIPTPNTCSRQGDFWLPKTRVSKVLFFCLKKTLKCHCYFFEAQIHSLNTFQILYINLDKEIFDNQKLPDLTQRFFS